jgi:CubicO group peptidase (beta-lactamase class C family)
VDDLRRSIDRLAEEEGFSGAVRVDRGGRVAFSRAYGFAHRGHRIPTTLGTRFAIASGTKGLTALTVVSLVAEGVLALDTPVRSLLGPDLPLIDDAVTVEHLLAHRSGIGDYLDEDAVPDVDEHVLPVPVHRLATTEDYLAVLDGHRQVFPPGERFAYNNGGFVVLALLAERATGVPFPDLVRDRVCRPAGMTGTAFLRSDEPGDAALGYLEATGLRTNLLHLPVVGSGDGGLTSTVDDVHALWGALLAGQVVPSGWVAEVLRPRSEAPAHRMRYGLGFWLHPTTDAVVLEGSDAGVSFRTVHDPAQRLTHTVVSNTSRGAWSIARVLRDALTPERPPTS